eukprot:SM000018S03631  [mRNA]  locus=s18:456370:463152:+ [translate_table: standard]
MPAPPGLCAQCGGLWRGGPAMAAVRLRVRQPPIPASELAAASAGTASARALPTASREAPTGRQQRAARRDRPGGAATTGDTIDLRLLDLGGSRRHTPADAPPVAAEDDHSGPARGGRRDAADGGLDDGLPVEDRDGMPCSAVELEDESVMADGRTNSGMGERPIEASALLPHAGGREGVDNGGQQRQKSKEALPAAALPPELDGVGEDGHAIDGAAVSLLVGHRGQPNARRAVGGEPLGREASAVPAAVHESHGGEPKLDWSGRLRTKRAARELALSMVVSAANSDRDPLQVLNARLAADRGRPALRPLAASVAFVRYIPGRGTRESDRGAAARCRPGVGLPLRCSPTGLSLPSGILRGTLDRRACRDLVVQPVVVKTGSTSSKHKLHTDGHLMQTPAGWSMELAELAVPLTAVFNDFVLSFCGSLVEAAAVKWSAHASIINQLVPHRWKGAEVDALLPRCILHLALAELEGLPTPYRVVMSEAVELSKLYCDPAAARVVNGCLGRYIRVRGEPWQRATSEQRAEVETSGEDIDKESDNMPQKGNGGMESLEWLLPAALGAETDVPSPAATFGSCDEADSVTPLASIDWDHIEFGLIATDAMFSMTCERGGEWQPGRLLPFGNLELSPSAGVLNYGQGVFEGLKAYRTADGRLLTFRPDQNAERMIASADRMSMPAPSVDAFVEAVRQTIRANERWIPPPGKGSLYVRPLLIGSGPILGLGPAPEYTFLVYCSPVGNYFRGGSLTPIDLKVEETYHRAAPGGTGAAKTIGNYAPVLKTQLEAKAKGFSDVVYLDVVENRYIEEVSSCNIFVVKDGEVATPDLVKGTILPGITRKSILELASSRGYKVAEKPIAVDELLAADEVFCTGTAVVVSPVGSVSFKDDVVHYGGGGVGPVSQELYTALTDLQLGKSQDHMGWVVEV